MNSTRQPSRSSDNTGLQLGRRLNGSFPLAGDIAEVLVYNRALTVSERSQVENYLARKYGIGSGGVSADFGYAGMYWHQPSGDYQTLFRIYDPPTARWLSRDPIAENGGINLYGYVSNNPIDLYDSLGLFFAAFTGAGGNTVGNADLASYAASQGGKAYDRTQTGQDQAAQDYQAALAANPNEPLNVAGYSRGTEAANNFAKQEGNSGHCVDHLTLIDPVSKFGLPLHLAIPPSVKQADDYYQNSGGPFQGGAAQPGPNVTNHEVSGPGVNHNTVVSTVVGGR